MHNLNAQSTAVLAGGCFWGMEELFRTQKGILATEVGYTGGDPQLAKYQFVREGTTGHAEALLIQFDPEETSYKQILFYFFDIHDPTTIHQQGNDIGSQYRSAIFWINNIQKQLAEETIQQINNLNFWKLPLLTSLEEFKSWHPAESKHQKYLQKNPNGYTCHWERKIIIIP